MKDEVSLVYIPADSVKLEGKLVIPEAAQGMVVFAHGSGSSRHSPRNNFVADVLQKAKFGTLLFDLLTEKEDENYQTRFDIDLLTERLILATKWLRKKRQIKELSLGYFGSSTGAAAALKAAANLGNTIGAVVSRGGRPDLAGEDLKILKSPTLLIVGGEDYGVIELNKQAYDLITAKKELKIIPGATHLFEEPGKLEQVAKLAVDWFSRHLVNP